MNFTWYMLFLALLPALSGPPANDYPIYHGNDLGLRYSPAGTTFKVWAPGASAVKLRLYTAGEGGTPLRTIDLDKQAQGVWATTLHQDIKNEYYTFQVDQDGRWLAES